MSATLDAKSVAELPGRLPGHRRPRPDVPREHQLRPCPHFARAATTSADTRPGRSAGRSTRPAIPATSWSFSPASRRSAEPRELEPLAASRDLAILPLHGSLPFDAQSRVPSSRRRGAKSSSLPTSPRPRSPSMASRTVIDSGLARVPSYDPRRGHGSARTQAHQPSLRQPSAPAGPGGRRLGDASASGRRSRTRTSTPSNCPRSTASTCAPRSCTSTSGANPTRGSSAGSSRPPEHMIASAEPHARHARRDQQPGRRQHHRAWPADPLHPRPPAPARLIIEAASKPASASPGATIAALFSEKDILLQADFSQPRLRAIVGRSDVLFRLDLIDVAEKAQFAASSDGPDDRPIGRPAGGSHAR